MKKSLKILVVVLSLVMVTVAFAANAKPVFKVGEEKSMSATAVRPAPVTPFQNTRANVSVARTW